MALAGASPPSSRPAPPPARRASTAPRAFACAVRRRRRRRAAAVAVSMRTLRAVSAARAPSTRSRAGRDSAKRSAARSFGDCSTFSHPQHDSRESPFTALVHSVLPAAAGDTAVASRSARRGALRLARATRPARHRLRADRRHRRRRNARTHRRRPRGRRRPCRTAARVAVVTDDPGSTRRCVAAGRELMRQGMRPR
jgi:hypothetical protein